VIFDGGDPDAGGDEAVDGRLAPAADAADLDFDLAHAHLADLVADALTCAGGGDGGGLAGALEARGSGRVPRDGFAVSVGDGDEGVVVRRPDVHDAAHHVATLLFDFLRHLYLAAGGSTIRSGRLDPRGCFFAGCSDSLTAGPCR